MYRFPLESAFFGLTPEYRNVLFAQIHDLVYHGGGGFQHTEVYNMPTWMRIFHIQKVNEFLEKKQKTIKEKTGQVNHNNKVMRPNIKPTSTYNF